MPDPGGCLAGRGGLNIRGDCCHGLIPMAAVLFLRLSAQSFRPAAYASLTMSLTALHSKNRYAI